MSVVGILTYSQLADLALKIRPRNHECEILDLMQLNSEFLLPKGIGHSRIVTMK